MIICPPWHPSLFLGSCSSIVEIFQSIGMRHTLASIQHFPMLSKARGLTFRHHGVRVSIDIPGSGRAASEKAFSDLTIWGG